jgi:hypothetical protein
VSELAVYIALFIVLVKTSARAIATFHLSPHHLFLMGIAAANYKNFWEMTKKRARP